MRILLTGGTGFLGSRILKRILELGHDVILLKRSTSNTYGIKDLLQYVAMYDVDLCGLDMPFRNEPQIDIVVHTATNYGRRNETLTDIVVSNVVQPLNLLELAMFNDVPRFINTDTILSPEINAYSLSKHQFKAWANRVLNLSECRLTLTNVMIHQMYGPFDDGNKFPSWVIRQCLSNVQAIRLTFGEQVRDFIYVDDVVNAFLTVIDAPQSGSTSVENVEIGTGTGVTLKEFVEVVKDLTNSTSQLEFGAIPYRKNEVMKAVADISALVERGWKPTVTLRDGLMIVIEEELKL